MARAGMAIQPGAPKAMLATVGVGVFLVAACAVKPPPPPGPRAVFTVEDPGVIVPGVLDPVAVSVNAAADALYVPWESQGQEERRNLRVQRRPADGEGDAASGGTQTAWRVSRFLVGPDGTETPQSQEDFVLNAEGAVALVESTDFVESVVVVFEPPMIVVPADLPPGETFSQQLSMIVYPMNDRTRPRTTGEATNEITYIGDERIRTPAPATPAHAALPANTPGEGRGSGDAGADAWNARHVRSVLSVKLGPAQVRNETDQWFVDEVGVVAEQRHERTTAMGVPLRNNLERWALQRIGPAEGTPAVASLRQKAR